MFAFHLVSGTKLNWKLNFKLYADDFSRLRGERLITPPKRASFYTTIASTVGMLCYLFMDILSKNDASFTPL